MGDICYGNDIMNETTDFEKFGKMYWGKGNFLIYFDEGRITMPDSNIIMYTTEDGLTKIETTFENDTVWLSINQMAELFQRDKSVVGKHVRNIFKEGELVKKSVWAKFAYTASDGKVYQRVLFVKQK